MCKKKNIKKKQSARQMFELKFQIHNCNVQEDFF